MLTNCALIVIEPSSVFYAVAGMVAIVVLQLILHRR